MASSVNKVIRRSILALVLIALVVGLRTAIFTTYYLGDADTVHLDGLTPHTLLFINKRSRTVEVSDDLIYQDPLTSGTTQRSLITLGRCVGKPGDVYHLNDSIVLPIPVRGEEISLDSAKVEMLLPLLLADMDEKAKDFSYEKLFKLTRTKRHRFSRDYFLLSTVYGTHVWISKEDIVGRVIGSVSLPF